MKIRSKIRIIIIAIGCAALLFWLWPRSLTVSHCEIQTDLSAPIRIVQLADLHSASFGDQNEELISLISAQKPDLIFMTGDMQDMGEEDTSIICDLISALSALSPVYYSYGNHEMKWISEFTGDLADDLTAAGAIILDQMYTDITVNDQPLRIGGYYGYYRTPHMDTKDEKAQEAKIAFAEEFEQTDRQKLLLCHIPTGWLDWEQIDEYDAGIVFCGHYHGGLIRMPLLERGLYAPYVGWFPQYTEGAFFGKKSICVLSAGLGTEHGIPRIYNPPEIVTVDLLPSN